MSENEPGCNGGNDLEGLKFVALCSFERDDLVTHLEQAGGEVNAISMESARAVEPNRQVTEFAGRLMTGKIDIVVFQNPLMIHFLLDSVRGQIPLERFQNSLRDATLISTNLATTRELTTAGFHADLSVAENQNQVESWRKVLQLVDEQVAISNLSLMILTDSESNPPLLSGLEARGAQVSELPILVWEVNGSAEYLKNVVSKIANRQFDILIFDSHRQIKRLAEVSYELSLESALRQALDDFTVVVSNAGVQDDSAEINFSADMVFDHLEVETLIQQCAGSLRSVVQAKRDTG